MYMKDMEKKSIFTHYQSITHSFLRRRNMGNLVLYARMWSGQMTFSSSKGRIYFPDHFLNWTRNIWLVFGISNLNGPGPERE